MIQAELDREVANVTGESVNEIKHRGFVPLRHVPFEREPLVVDWDELDAQRPVLFPMPHVFPREQCVADPVI